MGEVAERTGDAGAGPVGHGRARRVARRRRPARRRARRRRGCCSAGRRRACSASPPPGARCWPAAGSPSPTPPPRALARRLLDARGRAPGPGRCRARAAGRHRRRPGQGPDRGRRPPARRAPARPGRRDRRRRRLRRSRRPPACGRPHAPGAEVRVLRHDHPRGPAAARNAGLAAATTPLVAFLDSDVLPDPGWLEPLLAHLADPAVGLVAPRIVALAPPGGWAHAAAGWAATRPCGRRWTWARTRPPSCRAPGSPTSRARRCSCAARRSGRGSTTTCTSPRTSTSCCACTRAGWRHALRADVAGRPRPPHRPARVVAAQGLLRHRRGPARAAPPRRGAADGAEPVGRRGRRGAARPPPARAAGVAAWAVQRLVPQLPELSRPWAAAAPDHRARRGGCGRARPRTPSTATTGRSPPLACAVSGPGPQDGRGRRAGRGRRRLAAPPRP